MMRAILSRLYYWAHRITERRRMQKRLAVLEQRLAMHDKDMVSMSHFPARVQERMQEQRAAIVHQIETARRFV